MKLRSNKTIDSSLERPRTPVQDTVLKEPDTEERSRFFEAIQHNNNVTPFRDICAQHGIGKSTGYRWMKEFKKYNDCRRVRKRKSQEKHTKLGHPWRVDESTLRALMDDATNPVRDKPLGVQIRTNNIPLTKRALEHNLRTRIHAGVYKQAYTKKEISLDNKYLRVGYGYVNQ
jgi:hypothetical protein